jgi:UDP-N-acetyl-D-galactosamine dehydrogenase
MRVNKIGVIGLGYVGLPLASEFSKKYNVVGFDTNHSKINSLLEGKDYTNEIKDLSLLRSKNIIFTNSPEYLSDCNVYIITVPTPIDKFKEPDLLPLMKSSELISKYLKKNDIVIYESTVYPGCTEEICVPILEKKSKLKYNIDFFCGYSPERINPGDKINTLTKIKKVTSGSNLLTAKFVDTLYLSIIEAGTYMASSIKVAEASKAIENAQRDLNIAFVNELSIIFNLIGIDTNEVLEAANTKWNFLDFKPGLVGGHCIGVDPYYLAHKAKECGYHPDIILTGRKVNDSMGMYVANRVVKLLNSVNKSILNANVLIIGFAFKENCNE